MGNDLSQKAAVVTGASRGIGRALCLQLAKAGALVYAGARSKSELQGLEQSQENIRGIPLDVADPKSVQAFSQAVLAEQPIDYLINNAGVGVFKSIEELSVDDWDRIFDVNVRGTFLVTQAFLGSIRRQQGHIVNITSDVSGYTFAGGSLYTASKHAQRAFSRALQMEVEKDGVRVTEVRPGIVSTYFADNLPRTANQDALGADDVAEAVVFALTRPKRMRLDELLFHPTGQKTQF